LTTPTDKPPSPVKLVTNSEEHTAPPRSVIRLPVITTLDTDPDVVLQEAMGKLDCVVVLGYTKGEDGVEYFTSSISDGSLNVWLMQRAIYKLMVIAEPDDDDGTPTPVA